MAIPPTQRALLSDDEIAALDEALRVAYERHAQLCEEFPVARSRISRPAVPSVFSESLAAAVIPAFFGVEACTGFGGRVSDLLVSAGGRRHSIEVKASGASRFGEVKERDLAADALIWIDVGRRYVDGSGAITVHFLPAPHRYRVPRRKLTLDAFLAGATSIPGFKSLAFDDVAALLRLQPCEDSLPPGAPQTVIPALEHR